MIGRACRLAVVAVACLAVLWGNPASAHLTPNSEIQFSIGDDRVLADIIVPQGEYAFASGNPTGSSPRALDQARDYLAHRIAVLAPDGRAWQVRFRSVEFAQIAGPPDLHAVAELDPPAGASTRRFTIDWRAVIDTVPSHFALLVLTTDHSGMLGQDRRILGAVRAGSTRVAVDLGAPSAALAFANAFMIGVDHILEGYDHLLFLLALLLPAPLIASGGRWLGPRTLRVTARHLFGIVTAFTIGHSMTLIGATLWRWHLAAAPVEAAIAVSVLVSAIHAMRPLFPGREALIAAGFGLIHGLAFATLLANAGVGSGSGAVALLGFNLGIEAVQFSIVVLCLPALIVLSRVPEYAILRMATASFTAAAALAWIVNRTTGGAGAVVAAFETAIAHGLWAIGAAAVLALALVWRDRGTIRAVPAS